MLQIIKKRADELKLGMTGVDPVKLLVALCLQESNGGKDVSPNFEPAFWIGGTYFVEDTYAYALSGLDPVVRGSVATLVACSWGPWQLMYQTAVELGFRGRPWDLHDPQTAIGWTITYINKRTSAELAGKSERDAVWYIADEYNSGTGRDKSVPVNYCKSVLNFYQDGNAANKLVTLPVH